MRILDIKVTKGHLYQLILEGQTVLLDRDVVDACGLAPGHSLSEERIKQLYAESQLLRAKSRCLWYLERRDYTARELADKLYGKFEPEYIHAAISRIEELGLVNDAAYAQRKAECLLEEQGLSLRAVKQKLMQKGIDRATVDTVLENTAYNGASSARALIQKKYSAKIGTKEDVRRTYQALLRRGFSHTDIQLALKQIKEDLEFEE